MKRCPICGAILRPEELLSPCCGATCAACDALSEDELQKQYPVWYENLPWRDTVCDETIWMTKRPNQLGDRVDNVSKHFGWPGSLLMHSGRPDWVRHPVTGEELRVVDMPTVTVDCPSCGAAGERQVLELQTAPVIYVAACVTCGKFSWFTIDQNSS